MNNILNDSYNFLKQYTPYIIGGAIGSVINRMRNEMSLLQFIKSTTMSIILAVFVGISCKDYFGVKTENLIFMFCGISGAFSKYILDEFESIIKLSSIYVKSKINKNDTNN